MAGGTEEGIATEQLQSLQSQSSQTEPSGIDVPSLCYWALVHTQLQQGSRQWLTVFTVSKDLDVLFKVKGWKESFD